jgi:hypothetical protein
VISGGDSPLHYDIGDLRVTGALIALTLFRPAKNKAVLVVAAADRAAVEARLLPVCGTYVARPNRLPSNRLWTARARAVASYGGHSSPQKAKRLRSMLDADFRRRCMGCSESPAER